MTKKRLNLDFKKEVFDSIDRVAELMEARSRVETISRTLAVYEYLLLVNKRDGAKIMIQQPGQEPSELELIPGKA